MGSSQETLLWTQNDTRLANVAESLVVLTKRPLLK
jgi:hypothetical protein